MVPIDLQYLSNFYNFCFILSLYNMYIFQIEVATEGSDDDFFDFLEDFDP